MRAFAVSVAMLALFATACGTETRAERADFPAETVWPELDDGRAVQRLVERELGWERSRIVTLEARASESDERVAVVLVECARAANDLYPGVACGPPRGRGAYAAARVTVEGDDDLVARVAGIQPLRLEQPKPAAKAEVLRAVRSHLGGRAFEVVSIEGPQWPTGTYDVDVRVRPAAAGDDVVEQTLVVTGGAGEASVTGIRPSGGP